MAIRVGSVVKKTAKIIGISIGTLLLILFLLPYVLPDTISRKVKALVNHSIDGEVNFSRARLSFFKHFPALTLTLQDFTLKGSAPFKQDTLIAAKDVGFGINLSALLHGDITIDKFFINTANINVQVNEQGEANYNVYRSAGSTQNTSGGADTTAALKIDRIVIKNSNLVYNDLSSAVLLHAQGLSYTGNGDLSKGIFDLTSHIDIDAFDFYYDRQPYVQKKKINADLLTKVNTNSLELIFEKNRLKINQLPVTFTGKFDFLSRGYDMDFRLNSKDADLEDVFSVLPPSYQGWLKNTRIKGNANISTNLTGRYIGGTDTMPDLQFDMKVRNGYIAYKKAPAPVSNLYFDFDSKLPGLDPEHLQLQVDSVFFNLEKDYFSAVLKIKGFSAPDIFARVNSSVDLEKFDKALGLQDIDMKGKLNLHLDVNGKYSTGQNPARLRKDIIVTSIPSFYLQSSLQNGFVHYLPLPKAIDTINFTVSANCPDNNYHHTSAAIENIDIKALNNFITGFVHVKNAADFPVDAALKAQFDLADIQQFYPLDSVRLKGTVALNVNSSGNYVPAKKIFPKTEAVIKVENASVQTKYYPSPVEKIMIDATLQNKEGTFYDLVATIKPVSFEFEGKPFMVQADLQHLDNLNYDIVSKGELDLGKLAHVFSPGGWNMNGTIETDLSLKGNQADAAAGRYAKLHNSGTLKVHAITLNSDWYPKPFFIDKGVFRFHQDLMQFEAFRARYGRSSLTVNGSVSNVFNYLANAGPLRGTVQLNADKIILDELMAYNGDSTSVRTDTTAQKSSGVIIIPSNLDLNLDAAVKNVEYNKLSVKDIKGNVQVKDGVVKLNQAGFTLAGAETVMDASYKNLSATKAFFTYHIAIKDFDVQRMYKEVELFRQLAPAAAKANGIISLDYDLEGKLNSDMYPVMSSLQGGGTLSLSKVKMKGFRLFSAMSRKTGKNEINDPDLNKINLKTTIKNNVVTLEKTKIKVAGFRIRIQGQTNFDGAIKLKCRLGLPPFGIIGIPMNITGTGENPRIKLGKGDELPLEEQQEEMKDDNNDQ
ncbi:MAG TPA: AsmA family protein [Chitinophagaceae bacterium]|nr:AsmA family protein [Chitinophagaceae bacterium]